MDTWLVGNMPLLRPVFLASIINQSTWMFNYCLLFGLAHSEIVHKNQCFVTAGIGSSPVIHLNYLNTIKPSLYLSGYLKRFCTRVQVMRSSPLGCFSERLRSHTCERHLSHTFPEHAFKTRSSGYALFNLITCCEARCKLVPRFHDTAANNGQFKPDRQHRRFFKWRLISPF